MEGNLRSAASNFRSDKLVVLDVELKTAAEHNEWDDDKILGARRRCHYVEVCSSQLADMLGLSRLKYE